MKVYVLIEALFQERVDSVFLNEENAKKKCEQKNKEYRDKYPMLNGDPFYVQECTVEDA